MLDLDAVIQASGASQVDLFGISFGGLVAVRYAAENPERVKRLILWGTLPSNDRSTFPPEIQERQTALAALRRSDPELATRIFASQAFPSGVDPETFQFMVKANKEGATAEMAEQLESVRFDNREHLARVTVPTLVMHRRGDQVVPFAAGQYLARRLPNARFVPLEGDVHMPNFGDVDSVLGPILEFLAEDGVAVAPAVSTQSSSSPTGTAIILFTDIVDSTALTERLGDTVFRAASRTLDEGMRAAMREAGGAPDGGEGAGRWRHGRVHVGVAGDCRRSALHRTERRERAAPARRPPRGRCDPRSGVGVLVALAVAEAAHEAGDGVAQVQGTGSLRVASTSARARE